MNVNQISVFLENRAGQLAEITRVLADNDINMCAISIAETADYGVLRVIADNAEKATSILLNNGYILSKNPVMVVAVPDQAGGLASLLALLADNEIGIEYMYSLFPRKAGTAYMALRISDEIRFVEVLKANGMKPVTKEELGLK